MFINYLNSRETVEIKIKEKKKTNKTTYTHDIWCLQKMYTLLNSQNMITSPDAGKERRKRVVHTGKKNAEQVKLNKLVL